MDHSHHVCAVRAVWSGRRRGRDGGGGGRGGGRRQRGGRGDDAAGTQEAQGQPAARQGAHLRRGEHAREAGGHWLGRQRAVGRDAGRHARRPRAGEPRASLQTTPQLPRGPQGCVPPAPARRRSWPLVGCAARALPQVENVDDDMARELAFYKQVRTCASARLGEGRAYRAGAAHAHRAPLCMCACCARVQALSAAQQAIVRFDKAGVAWLRPRDYYAEMVRSPAAPAAAMPRRCWGAALALRPLGKSRPRGMPCRARAGQERPAHGQGQGAAHARAESHRAGRGEVRRRAPRVEAAGARADAPLTCRESGRRRSRFARGPAGGDGAPCPRSPRRRCRRCCCWRRRKAREAKQYAKQVQAEKQKERNQAKKSQIEQVSKLRKQRDKAVRGAHHLRHCTRSMAPR